LVPSALSRLRDAARARAFDDPGGVVALVADLEAARKDLTRLASAGAEYAGEALLRTMASVAAGAGPRADARACLAAGAGLLALSGSLAADAQPLRRRRRRRSTPPSRAPRAPRANDETKKNRRDPALPRRPVPAVGLARTRRPSTAW
jgi:hypothetical protein